MRYLVKIFEVEPEEQEQEQEQERDADEGDFELVPTAPTAPPPSIHICGGVSSASSASGAKGNGKGKAKSDLPAIGKARPSEAPGLQTTPLSDTAGVDASTGGYIHTIAITTVGLEDLPGIDTRDYEWNHENEQKIIEAYCKNYPTEYRPSLYMDARCFHEDRCEDKHIGELDNFLLKLTEHPAFKGWWLKEVKEAFVYNDRFNEEYADIDACFSILVACKAGINRSVGSASLLRAIFVDLGLDVIPAVHKSQRKWQARQYCDFCARCRCDRPSFLKKQAARKAVRVWHSL